MRSRLATRQKLIDAARRVMAEKGVEGASIADITEAADVGFGSFYNHFHSKVELAADILEAGARGVIRDTKLIQEREPDPAYRLSYICHLFIDESIRDPVWGMFLKQTRAILPDIGEMFAEAGRTNLRRGLEEGRFSLEHVETANLVHMCALNAVVTAHLNGQVDREAAFEAVEGLLRMVGLPAEEAAHVARAPLPDYLERPNEKPTKEKRARARPTDPSDDAALAERRKQKTTSETRRRQPRQPRAVRRSTQNAVGE